MNRYCLDTSAYSRFKAGVAEVAALLDAADWVGVPVTVLGELWLGFRLGLRTQHNRRDLRRFLDHPLVEIVPTDSATAEIWAEIVGDLRDAGTPVPINDVWIAATAVRTASTVLTFDRHFNAVPHCRTRVLSD